METHPFGEKAGFAISRLGFGAMRLPTVEMDGQSHVRAEEAIEVIHAAFEAGVNYIDTAYGYCNQESEVVVGKALKGWRERVYLSTKMPLHRLKAAGDGARLLEEQLRKLDTDRIDVYHLHGLSLERFHGPVAEYGVLADMEKALADGRIGCLSFSTHDAPENVTELIDTGLFASILCQYNLLDRRYAPAMAHAKAKGMGVVVMGPVGGGRLAAAYKVFAETVASAKSTPEIAIRFVGANPHVDCILSGMSDKAMVAENVATVTRTGPLTPEEAEAVEAALTECRRLAELYCTGCEYCMPCPHEVHIARAFEAMNYRTVYDMADHARRIYDSIDDQWIQKKKASACTGCGICEPKCPQNIPIRAQLAEVAKAFEGDKGGAS